MAGKLGEILIIFIMPVENNESSQIII